MNVLVTGGAGFIGSHLCDALLGGGKKVVVVDNLSLGRLENLSHIPRNSSFSFHQFDLLDQGRLDSLVRDERFDVVFHLAANSDIAVSHGDPGVDLKNTFLTTYAVLDAMRKAAVKNIVFASSSAIYGENPRPVCEDDGPLQPVSHYGAAKLAAEAFISSFCGNYGFKAWIARFPNVVGERATHGVIFDFVKKLRANPGSLEVLGNGEQFKPYLYVKDLVEAMILMWERSGAQLNVFNIGVESRTRVKTIAKMVIEEMGLDAAIRYTGGDRGWIGDVPEFDYRLDKIHALGWRAAASSDEAVRRSIRALLGKRG
jgi:UDP-glucose 4-epimerase